MREKPTFCAGWDCCSDELHSPRKTPTPSPPSLKEAKAEYAKLK